MFSNLKVAAVGALFLGLVALRAPASQPATRTRTPTTSRSAAAVALPGVELAAGTYIFETPTNSMSNSIVRVSSRDRRKVFLTAYTRQVERPKNDQGKLLVTLGEATPGAVPPVVGLVPYRRVRRAPVHLRQVIAGVGAVFRGLLRETAPARTARLLTSPLPASPGPLAPA